MSPCASQTGRAHSLKGICRGAFSVPVFLLLFESPESHRPGEHHGPHAGNDPSPLVLSLVPSSRTPLRPLSCCPGPSFFSLPFFFSCQKAQVSPSAGRKKPFPRVCPLLSSGSIFPPKIYQKESLPPWTYFLSLKILGHIFSKMMPFSELT